MNIEQIRKDTRGCDTKLFLNSAGSSLMPNIVIDTMFDYLRQEEMSGGYKTADQQQSQIHEFYESTAALINTLPQNISFASSATDAFAKALSSIDFKDGDIILTTKDDYVSNQIAFISLNKRYNVKIIRVENLENNELDLVLFEQYILKYKPKLIAVTHIPTSSGLIQDVVSIGKLCNQYDILYLVDACQSIGQIPVDVQTIQCDFLSATGRKFLRGPRGTGFLYVSEKVLMRNMYPLFVDSNGSTWNNENDFKIVSNAKRFEYWENSLASLVGLSTAIKYCLSIGIYNISDYSIPLIQSFRYDLNKIDRITTLDKGENLCNIITFKVDGMSLDDLEKILSQNEVYYSISRKTSALIDFTDKGIDWACRFSPHYFNTQDEISKVLEILKKSLK